MDSMSLLSLTPISSISLLKLKSPSLPFSTSTTRNSKLFCCLAVDTEKNAPSTRIGDNLRIMFAAGGTGGHIYPAVAIADELKTIDPSIQVLFAGTKHGMESTAIPSAGYDFVSIPAVPLTRPIFSLKNLLLPFRLFQYVVECRKVVRDFDPQVVFGTGGYVSFPVCIAAALNGLKVVIQEQNSMPGIANRVLSIFADLIFVAFNSSLEYFPKQKCIVSGNPVRLSLRRYASKAVARSHFFPKAAKSGDSEAKVVLVLGGSFGANAINIALLNIYYQMLQEHKSMFIIWQTGVQAFDEMESLVRNHSRLLLSPFLHSMDLAYAAADLVISRAGAMTCSEILATGKPSILIPSPNVAEGHQTKNAFIMADIAGSKVIMEDELDSTTLAIAIEETLAIMPSIVVLQHPSHFSTLDR
ncbi:UDP-N-acetylglucosamine--N-acetylmuramyl-(pentapeptide) pyrophosphoryl-undecaprenol N-acetylglucosamine transferase isoform X2 [Macadamia integrifolia]|uniref:UDP-N-acetylglucosamine--N-acetylmuramyl- (pentapeptide) pyrophosphoryl-undecaprenol N-acetylglucosamine transferase isoform X2 n=1 Tax=Macadamia integrifolia TaxID=60698 RepID=UPI001C4FD591|nr:UDP-N-acetylglucosamine--N-acetylmuramyl-(pentapeptide) pyrophosphoryl-undecaprenol N-acetylglucosamine transferase isoform X2 [Macadamia integrifolia]